MQSLESLVFISKFSAFLCILDIAKDSTFSKAFLLNSFKILNLGKNTLSSKFTLILSNTYGVEEVLEI